MIYYDKVSKIYPDKSVGLDDVSFTVEPKEFVTIVGQSGAGKTTLMKMLIAEDRPTDGAVYLESINIHKLGRGEMNRLRRRIGTVFQDYRLLPNKTVYENIAFAMEASGRKDAEVASDVPHVLELVDLSHKIWNFPGQLSGGERQRVAIARAIVTQPDIIIADEPTGNLDSKTAESIFSLFNDLVAHGKTVIIVTHDSGLAKRAHRTALIADGEIVNEYVARAMPTLTQDQMLQATRNAKSTIFEPGTMILAEGASADCFYIVSKGTVEVFLPRKNQSDVIATQLGPGKFFGEMALFHDRRRQASVRASEHGPVEVLSLSYDELSELLGQSEATRDFLRQIAESNEKRAAALRGAPS